MGPKDLCGLSSGDLPRLTPSDLPVADELYNPDQLHKEAHGIRPRGNSRSQIGSRHTARNTSLPHNISLDQKIQEFEQAHENVSVLQGKSEGTNTIAGHATKLFTLVYDGPVDGCYYQIRGESDFSRRNFRDRLERQNKTYVNIEEVFDAILKDHELRIREYVLEKYVDGHDKNIVDFYSHPNKLSNAKYRPIAQFRRAGRRDIVIDGLEGSMQVGDDLQIDPLEWKERIDIPVANRPGHFIAYAKPIRR